MGFVDVPHVCDLPFTVIGTIAKVGRYWECDHCKLTWQIQARVPWIGHESFYNLTWIRREGDYTYTRSWMETK